MDRLMDRGMDGQTEGWMDGWMAAAEAHQQSKGTRTTDTCDMKDPPRLRRCSMKKHAEADGRQEDGSSRSYGARVRMEPKQHHMPAGSCAPVPSAQDSRV